MNALFQVSGSQEPQPKRPGFRVNDDPSSDAGIFAAMLQQAGAGSRVSPSRHASPPTTYTRTHVTAAAPRTAAHAGTAVQERGAGGSGAIARDVARSGRQPETAAARPAGEAAVKAQTAAAANQTADQAGRQQGATPAAGQAVQTSDPNQQQTQTQVQVKAQAQAQAEAATQAQAQTQTQTQTQGQAVAALAADAAAAGAVTAGQPPVAGSTAQTAGEGGQPAVNPTAAGAQQLVQNAGPGLVPAVPAGTGGSTAVSGPAGNLAAQTVATDAPRVSPDGVAVKAAADGQAVPAQTAGLIGQPAANTAALAGGGGQQQATGDGGKPSQQAAADVPAQAAPGAAGGTTAGRLTFVQASQAAQASQASQAAQAGQAAQDARLARTVQAKPAAQVTPGTANAAPADPGAQATQAAQQASQQAAQGGQVQGQGGIAQASAGNAPGLPTRSGDGKADDGKAGPTQVGSIRSDAAAPPPGSWVWQGHGTAAAAAPTATPETVQPAPVQPRDILGQVMAKVKVSFNGERSEARIHLVPEQLGPVDLKVTLEGGQLTARFHVASSQVKEVLEQHLPELKQALHDQGIQVEQFSVSLGSGDQTRSAGQESRGNAWASHSGRQGYQAADFYGDEAGSLPAVLAATRNSSHQLDLIA